MMVRRCAILDSAISFNMLIDRVGDKQGGGIPVGDNPGADFVEYLDYLPYIEDSDHDDDRHTVSE